MYHCNIFQEKTFLQGFSSETNHWDVFRNFREYAVNPNGDRGFFVHLFEDKLFFLLL